MQTTIINRTSEYKKEANASNVTLEIYGIMFCFFGDIEQSIFKQVNSHSKISTRYMAKINKTDLANAIWF